MPRKAAEDDGKPFPTQFACSLLVVGLGTVLGLVPWLALSLPPVPRTDLPWWHAAIFHSFEGQSVSTVSSRLQLLQDNGVSAVIVGPVQIPKASDLQWKDEELISQGLDIGSTKEMDHLIQQAHQRGIKVILEFDPNHSGRDHPWFEQSETPDSDDPYRDLYVWRNPGGFEGTDNAPLPPNGWQTMSGGVAWTFSPRRQQFYFHQLDGDHPDLNHANPLVVGLIGDFLSLWTKRGVDGYFLRNAARLIEYEDTGEKEYVCSCDKETSSHVRGSVFTTHQNGSLSVLSAWRSQLDNAADHVFIAAEACSCESDLYREYYNHGVDLVVQPGLWGGQGTRDARCTWERATRWRQGLPSTKWPLWMEEEFGKQDDCRRPLVSLLLSMLPGAMIRRDSNGPVVDFQYEDKINLTTLRKHPAFIVGDTIPLLQETELLVFMQENEAKFFSKYIIAINFNSDTTYSLNILSNSTNPRAKIPTKGQVIIKTKPCSLIKDAADKLPIGTVLDIKQSSFLLQPNQGIVIQSL